MKHLVPDALTLVSAPVVLGAVVLMVKSAPVAVPAPEAANGLLSVTVQVSN